MQKIDGQRHFFCVSLTDFSGTYCKFKIDRLYFDKHMKLRKWRNMSRKEIVISNVSEEHNNPIAELVQVACRFESEIILESNNRRINAKSIMGIMAFNPSKGMTVNIVADGTDEEEALVAMERFLVCQ